jgi:hypothetical protein
MYFSPRIVTSGLVFTVDFADKNCYTGTGTAMNDLTGNSSAGVLSGTTFDGNNKGSIFFDGVSGQGSFNYSPSFVMSTNNFTVSTWVKIGTQVSSGFTKTMVSNYDSGKGYIVGWSTVSGGQFYIETSNGSSYSQNYSSNTWSSLINTWVNFVTIRQSGATNNGHFYINGVYESLSSAMVVYDITNTTYLSLGMTISGFAKFTGNIASVQIYNRALTATEVLQNYNATKSRFGR